MGGKVFENAYDAGNFDVLRASVCADEARGAQPKGVAGEHCVL